MRLTCVQQPARAETCPSRDLIVNSLPPSAAFDLSPIPIREGILAFDLTYWPTETPFLRAAGAAGAAVTNGVAMLVYQGAASLRIWTGQEPDTAAMFEAAGEALEANAERERGRG
jgi:shikimate dehydrogenase